MDGWMDDWFGVVWVVICLAVVQCSVFIVCSTVQWVSERNECVLYQSNNANGWCMIWCQYVHMCLFWTSASKAKLTDWRWMMAIFWKKRQWYMSFQSMKDCMIYGIVFPTILIPFDTIHRCTSYIQATNKVRLNDSQWMTHSWIFLGDMVLESALANGEFAIKRAARKAAFCFNIFDFVWF